MKSQGPIQLLLVMLLASLLKVKAQSSIAKTDNSEQYGIISKSTALTCTDSSAAPGSTFTFLKNNVIILTNLGEVGPSGKYSATASSGSIQMTIQDVVISDEDSYSCTVGFGAAASPYNLQVTVQPTNNTCTGPGNDYSGDLLTFTCTDLYPLPSVQSVMDGTQTIVGTNTTLKTNNLYDLQWTALASSSPKTYILAVAITTRSTYTVYLEITIKVPSTTPSTTSTTNMLPDTNTTHPTTSMPNGTTTSTTSKRPITDHGLPDWAIGVIAGGAFLAIVGVITIVAKKLNLCCFKKKDVEENQTGGNEQSANNIEQSEGIHMKTKV